MDRDHEHQRDQVPTLLVEPALIVLLNHELRTPLAAIKGFTGILLRYPQRFTPLEQRELLGEIQLGCARLEAVITQVVTVSEHAAGMNIPLPDVIDLARLVRHIVMTASVPTPLVTTPHWHYAVTVMPPRTMQVAGEARELTQVFEHLLKHARHSSPGGGTIAITLQRWHDPDAATDQADLPPQWELRVRDSGLLPSPEHVQSLAQLETNDDLTHGFAGRELGMLYCHLIASLYGGQMWVESTSQPGTTLHFLLPSVNKDET
jgi:two-component system sensor histidine kinase SaeS